MNDTWDITQDREENINKEIRVAPALEKDTEWGEYDGENDFADIATGHRVSKFC